MCKDQNKENSGLYTQTNHDSTGCGQQKSHYPQMWQVLMRTTTTNSVCTEESSSQKLVLRKQHRHSRGKEGGSTERGHCRTPQMHHPSWRHVAKAWTLLRQTSCPRCWAQQLVFGPRPSSLCHCLKHLLICWLLTLVSPSESAHPCISRTKGVPPYLAAQANGILYCPSLWHACLAFFSTFWATWNTPEQITDILGHGESETRHDH